MKGKEGKATFGKKGAETKEWEHVAVVVSKSVSTVMTCVTKWRDETKCHSSTLDVKIGSLHVSKANVYLGGTAMEILNARIIMSSNGESDIKRLATVSEQTSPRWSCEEGTCASPKIQEAACIGSRLIKFTEEVKAGKMNMHEVTVLANTTIVALNLQVHNGDADLYVRLPASAHKHHTYISKKRGSDYIKLNFNNALFEEVEGLSIIVKGDSKRSSGYTLYVEEEFPLVFSESTPVKKTDASVNSKVDELFEFRETGPKLRTSDGRDFSVSYSYVWIAAGALLTGGLLYLTKA